MRNKITNHPAEKLPGWLTVPVRVAWHMWLFGGSLSKTDLGDLYMIFSVVLVGGWGRMSFLCFHRCCVTSRHYLRTI